MRVGMVTQWYPPEKIWVPQAVANAISAVSQDILVVTGTPHYPSGVVEKGYSPFRFTSEVIDGIKVYRSPEYPYRGAAPLRRLVNYASFAVSSCYSTVRRLAKVDLLFVYSSPATAALPAMMMRVLFRKPYILQVQDIWPDSVLDSGFVTGPGWKRIVRATLDWFVNRSYRGASHIVVITESAKALLQSRGVPEDKLTVVYNWTPDPRSNVERSAISLRDKLGIGRNRAVFLYAGAIGHPQGLEDVINAFDMASVSESAVLVIVGSGVQKPEIEKIASRIDGVYVLDQVPIGQAAAWLEESDVGVVSLADTELNRATFPSKIQFLCGIGLPILIRAPGDASEFVTRNGIGVGVSAVGLESLAEGFRRLASERSRSDILTSMGRRSRELFEAEFSEEVGARRIKAVLDKTLSVT